jgi:hypothetical protein
VLGLGWLGVQEDRVQYRHRESSVGDAVAPQARSVSSDGLSRHGSGSAPEVGSHPHHQLGSQLETAPSTSTQAASVDGELLSDMPSMGSGSACSLIDHARIHRT